jgi:hypothetical protein
MVHSIAKNKKFSMGIYFEQQFSFCREKEILIWGRHGGLPPNPSISGCFFAGGSRNHGWRDKNMKKDREKAKSRTKFYKTFGQF